MIFVFDETDRILRQNYAQDFFSMVRMWHNDRADPSLEWHKLGLALASSSEPKLFIKDALRSPFNVGLRLPLEPFTAQEVIELNARYGAPLSAADCGTLHGLLGGHPFLTQDAYYKLFGPASMSFSHLCTKAAHDDGPFGDHLRAMLSNLQAGDGLLGALNAIRQSRVSRSSNSIGSKAPASPVAWTARSCRATRSTPISSVTPHERLRAAARAAGRRCRAARHRRLRSRRTDAELLDALQHDGSCNVLCPRQMGKTSTILRIRAELRSRGYRTALIDIAGRLGTPPNAADWYLGLLSQVSSQFGLDRDVKAWWAARDEPTPNEKLLTFFRDEILARESDRFVVFLDEINHTLNLGYTDDFFLAIRSLYDNQPPSDLRRLTFCLVGVFTPNELVKQRQTTTYNIGRTFELQDFNPERDDLTLARSAAGARRWRCAAACRPLVDGGTALPDGQHLQAGGRRGNRHHRGRRSPGRRLLRDPCHAGGRQQRQHPLRDYFARSLKQRARKPIETAELYRRILRGDRERDRPTPPVVALKLSGLVKTDRRGRLVIRNRIYRRRFDMDWATIVLLPGRPLRKRTRRAGSRRPSGDARRVCFRRRPLSEQVQKDLNPHADEPRRTVGKVFISHSSKDDAFVRELQRALADHGVSAWIDSRELRRRPAPARDPEGDRGGGGLRRGGQPGCAAVEVGRQGAAARARACRSERGKDKFPVIPLSLDGTKLGVLEEFFGEEPLYIPVSSAAGGVEAAMNAILVALGKRLPADVRATPQPKAEPLEELVLELTDLKFHEQDGVRRASARARLVYEPATPGQPDSRTARRAGASIAPIGPIEAEELRWYLEKYAIWPSDYFRDRARKVEGEPREVGTAPARSGDARGAHGERHAGLGARSATTPAAASPSTWMPRSKPARPTRT